MSRFRRLTCVADVYVDHGETAVSSPNLEKTAEFGGRAGVRSFALTGLFVLATFYTLYFARDFFIPIILALVFTFLLTPVVRALKRLHVPLALGSALVIIGILAAIGGIFYELSGPVASWLERVPEISTKLRIEVQRFRRPVEKVTQATQQVQSITAPPPAAQKAPPEVELKKPSPLAVLFTRTYTLIFGLVELIILLFFLLSSGDLFLRKMIHVLPRFEDKKRAVQIAREIEDNISRYLLTVAMINTGLGTAAAAVFWALGMPNPALWGAMGALLNFVPYLGALTTIGIVTVVSVATFPSVGHALLVPAAYLALGTLEGQFVTPWIVGRRMTLSPVVIFLGLVFWGWMWGIIGALLAVPMLVMFKIFCDHIEPLAPIGEFLGN